MPDEYVYDGDSAGFREYGNPSVALEECVNLLVAPEESPAGLDE